MLRSFLKFTNYDARQYIAEHFDRRPDFISHGAPRFDDRSNECGGRSIGGKFPTGDIVMIVFMLTGDDGNAELPLSKECTQFESSPASVKTETSITPFKQNETNG